MLNNIKRQGFRMLVKESFANTTHFVYHPEMMPHIGYNDVLIVDECLHFPGELLSGKAAAFMNWYDDFTPNHIEGLSNKEWNRYRAAINVRLLIMNNY